MTIVDYISSIRNKRVAVIGIGVSNIPLIRLLRKENIAVTACDKNDAAALGAVAEEMAELGVHLQLGPQYLDHLTQDIIFRTPGLRPDVPQLIEAQKRGAVLTSEMEVFFSVCPCKIIAVTGSDGKTTTTTLISEILKSAGYQVHVGGNIGNPLLAQVAAMNREDMVVLELSSFQLMTLKMSPDVAVITNITPNHLDVHKSMEEYISAKANIFLHQGANNKVILKFDNDITRSMAEQAMGEVVFFSRLQALSKGICCAEGEIISNGHTVLSKGDIILPGEHNVENYMAAIAATEDFVDASHVQQVATTFPGVEHRIELVRILDDVKYYNDSIASSPTRTIAGLHSFPQKVILIAGGYDKKIPFDELGVEIVKHVKHLILVGATAAKIREAVESAANYGEMGPTIQEFSTLKDAVEASRAIAVPGDIVTLSPACASFDQFKNFMLRGWAFKDLVLGW